MQDAGPDMGQERLEREGWVSIPSLEKPSVEGGGGGTCVV